MKKVTQKAFTLAEIMIVLTVIGILTAIILPSARNLMPDRNLMKFKKAHNTLLTAITELVNSDKYYLNGDLGIKFDGSTVEDNDDTRTYLCQTIADVINAKSVSCKTEQMTTQGYILLSNEYIHNIASGQKIKRTVTDETIKAAKESFDANCIKAGITMGPEIISVDNVVFYQAATRQFASKKTQPNVNNGLSDIISLRYFSPPNEYPANYADENGFDISYKIFCVDIDGIPDSATQTDCVNECPFGYGIRADGKILAGARAEQWLQKDINSND